MKKLIYLFFSTLVFIFALASCGKDVPKYPAIPAGATVLILGDSLSYGTGANKAEDYPSLLTKTTGWNIINEGVPGDTTAGGLARLPDLLEVYQPKLLIVELGGNDLLHQTSPMEIAQNLNSILGLAKAQGIQAILVAIPEISPFKAAVGSLSDHPLYEKLAKETNTPLIADVFSDVLSDRALKADQIHANAKGYAVVSDKLGERLKELGLLN
jgi:acyl-CoA thioesterase-1